MTVKDLLKTVGVLKKQLSEQKEFYEDIILSQREELERERDLTNITINLKDELKAKLKAVREHIKNLSKKPVPKSPIEPYGSYKMGWLDAVIYVSKELGLILPADSEGVKK